MHRESFVWFPLGVAGQLGDGGSSRIRTQDICRQCCVVGMVWQEHNFCQIQMPNALWISDSDFADL
jgi:hypothetical protein